MVLGRFGAWQALKAKKAFLEKVLNREYMQLSSHQASASVVDHLTALMGVEEKVEGS